MSEQETVHEESIQTDHETPPEIASGEDIASTVDSATINPQSSVLLSDAKRYRKRAQMAEKELQDTKQTLAEREKTLQEQQQTIASLQQRQAMDQALVEAGTIDLEAARTLAHAALSAVPQPDIAVAVAELQRSKPYLFRRLARNGKSGSGAMSARNGEDNSRAVVLTHAANEALETGRRSDLLRYLRLRRQS